MESYTCELNTLLFPEEYIREISNKEDDFNLIFKREIFDSIPRVVVSQSQYRYLGQLETKYIYPDEESRFPVRTITYMTDDAGQYIDITDYEYLEFDSVRNWLRRRISSKTYGYDYPALSDEPSIDVQEEIMEQTAEYIYY